MAEAVSWRSQLARAMRAPEESADVAIAWRGFLEYMARTAPAGGPAQAAFDLSDDEAAVLERGTADLTVSPGKAARVLGRSAAAWVDLVRDCLTATTAAEILNVRESRVRQRLADRTLYGFKYEGAWRFPRVQFDDELSGAVPGIATVFPALPEGINPLAVVRWFTLPTWELVREDKPTSPRRWLLMGGDPSSVAALAALL